MPHALPPKQGSSYRIGVTDEEAEQHAAAPPRSPNDELAVDEIPETKVLHQVRHNSVMKELNVTSETEAVDEESSDILSPLSKAHSRRKHPQV